MQKYIFFRFAVFVRPYYRLPMKNALLGFLMLIMLMPGLACAMPSCMQGAGHQIASTPCHDGQASEGKNHTLKLYKDCAKADLQSAGSDILKKPDFSKGVYAALRPEHVGAAVLQPAASRTIRGPPDDWPGMTRTTPPILLTTLRIRQ